MGNRRCVLSVSSPKESIWLLEEERIRSKVQKMAETEISYNLSGKVRAADITSLLMKVTNNDCDMLNTMSKKVLKNMPNYNYSSTNNTHKPLPESSLSRYSESDNKQFVEMDITKSLNIDNDYRTDRNLQKAHKSLPEIESDHLTLKGSDLIQEARLVLSKAKLQSNLDKQTFNKLSASLGVHQYELEKTKKETNQEDTLENRRCVLSVSSPKESIWLLEEERIRSKVQKMAETEISYNLSGKVRAADITSLLMKVTNND